MSGLRESHCPICRRPYYHFSTICEMFHYLLLKLYPLTYKRRENQIMEEENKDGLFSPQLDGHASALIADKDCNHLMDSVNSCTTTCESKSCLSPSSAKKDPNANMEQLESTFTIQGNDMTFSQHLCGESFEVQKADTSAKENLSQNKLNESCKQISIADVLCIACKQLLFRPVVLNCGHVYCETCIENPADQMIRCEACHSFHPRGFPKVCLELAEFLKEQFPMDYALRRDTVQQKEVSFENETQTTSPTKAGKEGFPLSSVPATENTLWWADPTLKIHVGVGCDFCGMMPIVGDRYQCKDCEEAIGFDLCGDCYNTRSKRPGRFNQKHTPEHKFELVNSSILQSMMLRLMTGQSQNVPSTVLLSGDAPENSERSEDVPSPLFPSDDVPEVSENEYIAFMLSGEAPQSRGDSNHNNGIEDLNESQSPN
ncbi:E3 ubiquitin-protein ligase PRT1-like isoform X2 [Tripterygium wilfordii]|nr:E3 ubiquitin-protein ligase PRT1-like isoform X2 [Tripterygium wilfordii]